MGEFTPSVAVCPRTHPSLRVSGAAQDIENTLLVLPASLGPCCRRAIPRVVSRRLDRGHGSRASLASLLEGINAGICSNRLLAYYSSTHERWRFIRAEGHKGEGCRVHIPVAVRLESVPGCTLRLYSRSSSLFVGFDAEETARARFRNVPSLGVVNTALLSTTSSRHRPPPPVPPSYITLPDVPHLFHRPTPRPHG